MMKNGTKTALVRKMGHFLASETGRRALGLGLWFSGSFCMAAASLERSFQPLALGLVCACPGGWRAVAAAVGGGLGYLWFWGSGGWQGVFWMGRGWR